MSRPWSLRARLVVASFVWTVALMIMLGTITTVLGRYHIHITPGLHFSLIAVLCSLGISAGFAQLRLGVAPFEKLRARLTAVRDGRDRTITGEYPAEVQPLVDDLNALLDDRDRAVRRAQSGAGDLAHGLKTPLAVIAHESARAAAAGQTELAAALDEQVQRMRRQIEFHLAHARAAASGATLNARSLVQESVDGLVRAVRRLHVERGLHIEVDVTADMAVRCQREDLDEMLGNLIDNACKWTRARVVIHGIRERDTIVTTVDDDGTGLPEAMRATVLQRGVRADEAAPGSGLGLAIVRDLAELYGGSIALTQSPFGGLRAILRLPSA